MIKIKTLETITGAETLKVMELINHGEDAQRIADVEGIPLHMVLAVERMVKGIRVH